MKTCQSNASQLEKRHQSDGRLTAILNTPFKTENRDFVTWLCLCDHGIPELEAAIQENFKKIQAFLSKVIDSLTAKIIEQRSDLNQTASAKVSRRTSDVIRLNRKSIGRVESKIDQEVSSFFKKLFQEGNLSDDKLPSCLIIESCYFTKRGKKSCGCICAERLDSLVIKQGNGKTILIPIAQIAKKYNVNERTIRNRASNPNATLTEIIHGLQSRHKSSKSGSIASARVVTKLIRQLYEETVVADDKEKSELVLKKISETSNLTPEHRFIFRSRFFTESAASFRALAESPFLQCSHEQVRKLELELLDKICTAYRLEPIHTHQA